MQAEDLGHVSDAVQFAIDACVKTCRSEGSEYTHRTRAKLIESLNKSTTRGERLSVTRMLAAVEKLIEEMELPLRERVSP